MRERFPNTSAKIEDDYTLVGSFLQSNPVYNRQVNFQPIPEMMARRSATDKQPPSESPLNEVLSERKSVIPETQPKITTDSQEIPSPVAVEAAAPDLEAPTSSPPVETEVSETGQVVQPQPQAQPSDKRQARIESGEMASEESRSWARKAWDWLGDLQPRDSAIDHQTQRETSAAETTERIRSDIENYQAQELPQVARGLEQVNKRLNDLRETTPAIQDHVTFLGEQPVTGEYFRVQNEAGEWEVLPKNDPLVVQIKRDENLIRFSQQLNNKVDRILKEVGAQTYFGSSVRGFARATLSDLLTINMGSVARQKMMADVLNKWDSGEELTDYENAMMASIALYTQTLAEAQTTMFGDAAHGLTEVAPFLAWFAATRGMSAVPFAKWQTFLAKYVTNPYLNATLQTGGFVVTQGGRFVVNPQTYEDLLQRTGGSAMLQEEWGVTQELFDDEGNLQIERIPGEPFSDVWWKSVLMGAADPVMNSSGLHLQRLATHMATRLANNPASRNAFIRSLKQIGEKNFGKFGQRVGYHGFAIELIEEQMVAVVQQGIVENNWGFFIDPRQQGTLFLTIAGMSGTFGGLRGGAGFANRVVADRENRQKLARGHQILDKQRRHLADILSEDQYSFVMEVEQNTIPSKQIEALMEMQDLTSEQVSAIMGYMFQSHNLRGMQAALDAQKNADALKDLEAIEVDAESYLDQISHEDGNIYEVQAMVPGVGMVDGAIIKGDPMVESDAMLFKYERTEGKYDVAMISTKDLNPQSLRQSTRDEAMSEIMAQQAMEAQERLDAHRIQNEIMAVEALDMVVPGTRIEFEGRGGVVMQNLTTDGHGILVRFDGDTNPNSPGELVPLDDFNKLEIVEEANVQSRDREAEQGVQETETQEADATQEATGEGEGQPLREQPPVVEGQDDAALQPGQVPRLETGAVDFNSITEPAMMAEAIQMEFGESALDVLRHHVEVNQKKIEDRQAQRPDDLNKQAEIRDEIRELSRKVDLYQETIEFIEAERQAIRADDNVVQEINELPLTHVSGIGMGQNQAAGTYVSTEAQNRYATEDSPAQPVTVNIENPYIVKTDPGLVDFRNSLLRENLEEFTDADFEGGQRLMSRNVTIEDLSDAGMQKLAHMVTETLQQQGYDSIYFRESETQEGELVVFNNENVQFQEVAPEKSTADADQAVAEPVSDIDAIAEADAAIRDDAEVFQEVPQEVESEVDVAPDAVPDVETPPPPAEPILAQGVDSLQREGQVQGEPAPRSNIVHVDKKGNTVVLQDGELRIFDKDGVEIPEYVGEKNKHGRQKSNRRFRDIRSDYRKNIDLTQGDASHSVVEKRVDRGEMHPDDLRTMSQKEIVSEYSENPGEVLMELTDTPATVDHLPEMSHNDRMIAQHITKVKPQSFYDNADKNLVTRGDRRLDGQFQAAWFDSKNGVAMDALLQQINAEFQKGMDTGSETISMHELTDFMLRYPGGKSEFVDTPNPEYVALASRFYELTGMEHTPALLQRAQAERQEIHNALWERVEEEVNHSALVDFVESMSEQEYNDYMQQLREAQTPEDMPMAPDALYIEGEQGVIPVWETETEVQTENLQQDAREPQQPRDDAQLDARESREAERRVDSEDGAVPDVRADQQIDSAPREASPEADASVIKDQADQLHSERVKQEKQAKNESDRKLRDSDQQTPGDAARRDSDVRADESSKAIRQPSGVVDRRADGERPPLVWQSRDKLPAPTDHVAKSHLNQDALEPDQIHGINAALTAFLDKNRKGFLLADGTGVGKTRQILGVASEFKRLYPNENVVVITQNKQIIQNNFNEDANAMDVSLGDFHIGTYADLRTGKLPTQAGLVIFDEAHNLKTFDSKQAIAARNINARHKMYVTATPTDVSHGSAYFLSEISNLTPEQVYKKLGFEIKPLRDAKNRPTGEYILSVQQGTSFQDIQNNFIILRDQIIEAGGMLRREFPFYGSLQETNTPLTQTQMAEQRQIEDYWYNQIAEAEAANESGRIHPRRKAQFMMHLSNELSRWNELNKLNQVLDNALKDIRNGRKVVILSEGVNPTFIKGLGREVPGFITELKSRLQAEGIDFAEVYGQGDKALANRKFQEGNTQVLIGTDKSAAAGINLDDTSGNSPRTLYIVTPSYSGTTIDQMLGRVSRRNTKSPAQAVFMYNDSASDTRRKEIVGQKVALLKAIQHGRVTDNVKLDNVQQAKPKDTRTGERVEHTDQTVPITDSIGLEAISKRAFIIRGDIEHLMPEIRERTGLDPWKHKKTGMYMFPMKHQDTVVQIIKNDSGQGLLALREEAPETYDAASPHFRQTEASLMPKRPIKKQHLDSIKKLDEITQRVVFERIGEYDSSLEAMSQRHREAKRTYESEKRRLGERFNQEQANLFGETPAQQQQTLFDMPGIDLGRENVQSILAPLKAEMDALNNAINNANNQRDAFVAEAAKHANKQTSLDLRAETEGRAPRWFERLFDRKHQRVVKVVGEMNAITNFTGELIVARSNIDLIAQMKALGEHESYIEYLRKRPVAGVYSPISNRVYLVSDVAGSTPEAIRKLWIHEVGVHYGLRQLFPDQSTMDRVCERVYESVGEDGFRAIFDNPQGWKPYADRSPAQKGDEYMARLAEKMDMGDLLNPRQKKAWERIMEIIRDVLNKVFGTHTRLTDGEIRDIIRASVGKATRTNDNTVQSNSVEARMERLERRAKQEEAYTSGKPVPVSEANPHATALSLSIVTPEGALKVENQPVKKGMSDWIKYRFSDVMVGMKNIQDAIEKETGTKIPDFANPYRAENHARSKIKHASERFEAEEGHLFLESVKAMTRLGLSQEQLHDYMVAKHATERNYQKRGEMIDALRKRQEEKMSAFINENPLAKSEYANRVVTEMNETKSRIENEIADLVAEGTERAAGKIEMLQQAHDGIVKELAETNAEISRLNAEISYMLNSNEAQVEAVIERIKNRDYSGISELDTDNIWESPDELAQTMVHEVEGRIPEENITDFWNNARQVTRFALYNARRAGELSHAEYTKYHNMYEFYVPLRGWKFDTKSDIFQYGDGRGISEVFNPVIRRAKGRVTMPDNPIPMMMSMAHSSIVQRVKNEVGQHALNLARLYPGNEMVYSRIVYLVEQEDGTIVEQVERPPQALFDQDRVHVQKNDQHTNRVAKRLSEEHEMTVFEDGKKYVVAFSDPSVPRAFMHQTDASWARGVGWYTRMLSAWLTSKNPNWIWANQIRDVQFAATSHWVNMSANNPGFVRQFLKNTPVASKAIRRAQKGKADPVENHIDRYYQEWQRAGGETGYVHMYSLQNLAKKLERTTREAVENRGVTTLKKLWRAEMEITETFAKWSENTSRFSTYLTARQQVNDDGSHKFSVSRAVELSKNADVNYDRRGLWTKHFSAVYAFFNPTIQAVAKTIEFARNNPKRFMAAWILYSLRGYVENMMFDMFGDEDEEGVRDYDKTSPFLRRFYTMVGTGNIIPGFNSNLSIPDPHNWRGARAIGAIFYDYQSGRIDADDMIAQSIGAMGEAFSPWSLQGFVNSQGEPSMRPLVPTAFTPAYELWVNENFTGRPIRPERFNRIQDRDMPNVTNHWSFVNPAIKRATYAWYEMHGGDTTAETKYFYKDGERRSVPWHADLNPHNVEHLINTMFGGRGRWYNQLYKTTGGIVQTVQNMSDAERETSFAEEISMNFTMYDTPILSRFFRTPLTDVINREYWGAVDKANRDKVMYEEYQRQQNWDKVHKLQQNRAFMESVEIANRHVAIRGLLESERAARAQGMDVAADMMREMAREMQIEIVQQTTRRPLPGQTNEWVDRVRQVFD